MTSVSRSSAAQEQASYQGPERRRRRVYVTANHEYFCRDGLCVAVRDVRTGAFLSQHVALGRHASAAIRMRPSGRPGGIESIVVPDQARPGERMHFALSAEDRHDVLTGPLRAVERPAREVVAEYEPAE
jgi:hypothetical protein